MTSSAPPLSASSNQAPTSLWIEPWQGSTTEENGHDPRSPYVEKYWLGVIGPTATWLLRHVADEFDRRPDGFEMKVAPTALQLGISPKAGPRGGLHRTLHRLTLFRLAAAGHASFTVLRYLPSVSASQLRRMPEHLQRAHPSNSFGAQPYHRPSRRPAA